ncbi:hypothetical protein [Streptomyces lunaelactis]|uniref:hypothetical protein n=1 Tax=Streptomyces lunaelactis TaxID=1535768 RepID=UPI0020C7C1F9|nr:hypothetical protein [Streptomyces lunaelactis]
MAVAAAEPVRTRLMLALAYDAALGLAVAELRKADEVDAEVLAHISPARSCRTRPC